MDTYTGYDTKYQGNTIQPKEHSNPLVTGPKEMEIPELADKNFKIIILKVLRELQENTDQENNTRIWKFTKELENTKKESNKFCSLRIQ